MAAVTARAPCRVDFAGGTLDIWPLGLLHPGATTVNVAVDLWQSVTLREASNDRVRGAAGEMQDFPTRRELAAQTDWRLLASILEFAQCPPVEMAVSSALPPGSGLGGSSALTVAALAAAFRLKWQPDPEPRRLARWARDIEARHMSLPTGLQDHYPALLGGALAIRHEIGGEVVDQLDVDLEALAAHLVVAHTGKSHVSAAQNWKVIRGRLEGHYQTEFEEIREAGSIAARALSRGEFRELAAAMELDWRARRRFDGVATPGVEAALEGSSTGRGLGR